MGIISTSRLPSLTSLNNNNHYSDTKNELLHNTLPPFHLDQDRE
jgi:hypothetical protein